MGIRTPETALTVYTISNRAPSASSDTSPKMTLIIIAKKSVKVKDFCFGAKTKEAQIQNEIDDGTEEDTDEDLIKNKDSLSSSVKTTKEASSSITCDPDLAECSDINKQ